MHPRDSCVKGGADSLSLSLQYLDHKARETMKGAAMQPPLPDPSQWVLGSGFMSLLGVSLSFHFRGLDFSLSQLIKIPSQGCQPWITGCSDKSLPGEGGGLELLSEGLGPSALLWETGTAANGPCPPLLSPEGASLGIGK